MNEAISATIAHIQTGMKPLEEQLSAKKKLVNALCAEAGEPPIYADVDFPATATNGSVRPDQYFGRPTATVAREILERRRAIGQGAMPLNDLYEAMKAGGFEFSTKDETNAKTAVSTTLGKNPGFIKVPNTGHWGLSEWYPGAKRNKPSDANDADKSGSKSTKDAATTPTAFVASDPATPTSSVDFDIEDPI
jgi:hypothetical protein